MLSFANKALYANALLIISFLVSSCKCNNKYEYVNQTNDDINHITAYGRTDYPSNNYLLDIHIDRSDEWNKGESVEPESIQIECSIGKTRLQYIGKIEGVYQFRSEEEIDNKEKLTISIRASYNSNSNPTVEKRHFELSAERKYRFSVH
jgi:hypothetical protein